MTTSVVKYTASKALFSFFGNSFRFERPEGGLAYYVKQKAFRLKEEINVFADEASSQLRLTIKARGIGDSRGTYDVTDATTGQVVGAAQRNLLKSFILDDWNLLAPDGTAIGKLREKPNFLAFLRKFIKMIPQTYLLEIDGQPKGEIRQRFHPFRLIYDVELNGIDERLGVAATVLILAIESMKD